MGATTVTDVSGVVSYVAMTIPDTIALRGMNTQTTTIRYQDPSQNTVLLQMGNNCRVEDLTLTLGSSSNSRTTQQTGIYFGGGTSVTAKLRTCVLNVCNANMAHTSSNNVYGVQFDGTGTLGANTFSFNSLKGSTINVYANGSGNKRGIIVTGSNVCSTRDVNVYVARPGTSNTAFAGSYVGVETRDVNSLGSIQLRSTTVGAVQPTGSETYTASDILQTYPATISNPTYLASAGIQIGPGVDLVTKTAGGKGFSTYNYPTALFYCAIGSLRTSGVGGTGGYLWPGAVQTNSGQGQGVKYPDITAPGGYRVQQPFILSGILVFCNQAPGSTSTTTVTVRRTPSGGSIASITGYSLTLSGTTTTASYYDTSQTFGAGDVIYVLVSYTDGSSNNATADLTVQLDCF